MPDDRRVPLKIIIRRRGARLYNILYLYIKDS